MTPDGRALPNLDEFMLRLGHLTVACDVASELGGSAYRISQELGDRLTRRCRVPHAERESLARYLTQKGLCPTSSASEKDQNWRYPELTVVIRGESHEIFASDEPDVEVWWQDYMLAQPDVPSRVGGVTVAAKSGSKSSLSHILDWASLLDLITAGGDLLPEGRLVTNVFKTVANANPYAVGVESIVYAWQYLRADFDIVAKLAPMIIRHDNLIRRKEATSIFVEAVEKLEAEAASVRSLSNRQYEAIYAVQNDLQRAADRASKPVSGTSTAWHRASSRFETLVDLGFLIKAPAGSATAPYTYQYAPADKLRLFVETVGLSATVEAWFDEHFLSVFLQQNSTCDPTLTAKTLADALDLMGSSSALVGIETLILALAVLSALESKDVSTIKDWRRVLLRVSREHPEIARLSGGRYGPGAQFISIRRRKLEAFGDRVL